MKKMIIGLAVVLSVICESGYAETTAQKKEKFEKRKQNAVVECKIKFKPNQNPKTSNYAQPGTPNYRACVANVKNVQFVNGTSEIFPTE